MSSKIDCGECMGTGGIGQLETCKHCKGTGKLAAPVVERQPALWIDAAYLRDHSNECIPAFREPPSCEPTALYRAPPELAELQAAIARLTVELTTARQKITAMNHDFDVWDVDTKALKAENERLKGSDK
jgi:hypothetical protein